ncbi:MAG: SAM-dependent methyltransferase [Opitutales bacterium]
MPEIKQSVLDLIGEQCAEAPVSYRDFIELALYAEDCGYYRRDTLRVGRSQDRDFYTAESLGKVFARLVVGAAEQLLGPEQTARSCFIEIAAEPGQSLLDALPSHPFAGTQVIRQGEPITASGPVVIFANEWLDALPFHRLVFQDGRWQERGVIFEEGKLRERLLKKPSPAVCEAIQNLPTEIETGYQLDLPLEAEAALGRLVAQDWSGLLLLFDYGKTWQALMQDCPKGTARTFYRQEAGNDLLDRPGEKDITCDICWTPLATLLEKAGFGSITLESQESFLVQRAAQTAESIVTDSAGQFSPDRQTLMELIHPANMGQRFQVLWGLRGIGKSVGPAAC